MPPFGPIKRRDLIRNLRELGSGFHLAVVDLESDISQEHVQKIAVKLVHVQITETRARLNARTLHPFVEWNVITRQW